MINLTPCFLEEVSNLNLTLDSRVRRGLDNVMNTCIKGLFYFSSKIKAFKIFLNFRVPHICHRLFSKHPIALRNNLHDEVMNGFKLFTMKVQYPDSS